MGIKNLDNYCLKNEPMLNFGSDELLPKDWADKMTLRSIYGLRIHLKNVYFDDRQNFIRVAFKRDVEKETYKFMSKFVKKEGYDI